MWTLCREMLLMAIPTPCRVYGRLRDPAQAASDPCNPHPHPSWHLQLLPGIKHSTPEHPKRPAALQLDVEQVKQTLAEFPEQLQRFHSPGISLAAPTTSPMPGKGCSMLEAPGWFLILVSLSMFTFSCFQ